MDLGDGGCSKQRWHHCTPAWVTEQDSIKKRKKEREKERKRTKERKRKKKGKKKGKKGKKKKESGNKTT